jgi:hypothetical protein
LEVEGSEGKSRKLIYPMKIASKASKGRELGSGPYGALCAIAGRVSMARLVINDVADSKWRQLETSEDLKTME